jgi:hypothetical protein
MGILTMIQSTRKPANRIKLYIYWERVPFGIRYAFNYPRDNCYTNKEKKTQELHRSALRIRVMHKVKACMRMRYVNIHNEGNPS